MDQGQPPENVGPPPDNAEPPDDYRSVKSSLKSVVRNPATQQAILEVVTKSHCIVAHAMQFLKLYLLVLFEAKAKLPRITEKLVLCIMIVLCEEEGEEHAEGEERPAKRGRPANDATRELKETLRAFHHEHYRPTMMVPGERLGFTNMAQLLKYEAKALVTAYETNIKLHFAQYLDRFLGALYEKKARAAAEKNKRLAEKRERAPSASVPTRASPAPSASTVPAKKKKTDTPYVERSDSSKRVLGLDPGKSDLIYCSGGTDKHDWFRYTQNQRRRETGTKKHQRRRKKMAAEFVEGKTVTEWEAELSTFNRKALSVAGAKAYFTKKNEVNAKLGAHYEQEVYRVLKWHAFVNRQRSEARMINRFRAKFGGKDDVVLAWGDWGVGSHHMKFHEPTKSVGMRKLFLRAGYEVVMVHESYTSRRCFNCKGGECEKFRSVENPRPWMRVEKPMVLRHGLLSCKNCKQLWNRDRNGSLNIMRIAQEVRAGRSRPSYLGRDFSAAIPAVTTRDTNGGTGLPTTSLAAGFVAN